MKSNQLIQLIRRTSEILSQEGDRHQISSIETTARNYGDNIIDFIRDLVESGNKYRLIFLENAISPEEFKSQLEEFAIPLVTFMNVDGQPEPVILRRIKNKWTVEYIHGDETDTEPELLEDSMLDELVLQDHKVIYLGVFAYKSLVTNDLTDEQGEKKLTPVQRLLRLLSEEKKDIGYIYIYAIFIGLISLTLPLGIQATVSLISGGVFFSSVYILIALVIFGVLAAGGLQIMQISLVEYLQRRVFTKAAFEFAFRVPRIRAEALIRYHAPELMNRFFDVLTIQKGLPKLLIDLSSGAIQILFGLILLSFYHPFFVFFSMLLVGLLTMIFYWTGPRGLNSSIQESKYKYRVVYWLEELARTIYSFKLSGNSQLPIRKTDQFVSNYLVNRKSHFNILIYQYGFIVLFKALVTGGLLIIGTLLVVQREITLGQFVASEVIIILVLSSVEKIIMYMDTIYDMLTAVEKIANVTDLPIERSGGLNIPERNGGYGIKIRSLYYRSPNKTTPLLNDINLTINPGERICISGKSGAGKSLLMDLVSGLKQGYDGMITINDFSVRDLDLMNLRDLIGKNVSQEDIFEGTILENILVGKPHLNPEDAVRAITSVGIAEEINSMPDGLNTRVISGGKGLPVSLVNRIILARCLAKNPRLLILNDYFNGFFKSERIELMEMVTRKENNWTLIVVSNDPLIMASCDRVMLMEGGRLAADDSFSNLMKKGILNEYVE